MNALEVARIKSKHTCLDKTPLSWDDKLAYLSFAQAQGLEGEAPVSHIFEDQMYIREIFVPKDRFFVGRPHILGHEVRMLVGKAIHIMEHARQEVEAPYTFHTVPGYITCFVSATDIVGRSYHPNPKELRDVSVLEKQYFGSATAMIQRGQAIADKAEALGLTLDNFLRYAAWPDLRR